MSYFEVFAIETLPAPELGSKIVHLREKLNLAQALHLTKQVETIERDIATLERGSRINAVPFSWDQVLIWKAFLPTKYANDETAGRQLKDYNFDRIPSPVLQVWSAHQESGLFDAFEIWTPERQQNDPMLIGIVGHARYLLARWGESDANLLSWEDVKKTVMWQRRMGRDRFFKAFFPTFCFAVVFLWLVLLSVASSGSISLNLVGGWGLMTVAVFLYFQFIRQDDVQKAIARDNAKHTERTLKAMASTD